MVKMTNSVTYIFYHSLLKKEKGHTNIQTDLHKHTQADTHTPQTNTLHTSNAVTDSTWTHSDREMGNEMNGRQTCAHSHHYNA